MTNRPVGGMFPPIQSDLRACCPTDVCDEWDNEIPASEWVMGNIPITRHTMSSGWGDVPPDPIRPEGMLPN